jgi:hypothetical protein
MYRGETFTLKRDAQAWAQQIEVQAEHIVSGYQPVPDHYSVGDLIDGYTLECNMGGRTKQATHAMLKSELGSIPLKRHNGTAPAEVRSRFLATVDADKSAVDAQRAKAAADEAAGMLPF